MHKKIISLGLIWFGLYIGNNILYYNAPKYQQHPTQIVDYITSTTKEYPAYQPNFIKVDTLSKLKPKKCKIQDFLQQMANIECPNGNFKIVNPYGYMGKYQFSSQALKSCKIKLKPSQFRHNPSLFTEKMQDKAFLKFCQANREEMKPMIKKYKGRKIKNIRIGETNIVAASHAGTGRVSTFLRSNGRHDPKDGNGVPISFYLKKFERFSINFDNI